jgi:L-lysine 2,3-aminomutase
MPSPVPDVHDVEPRYRPVTRSNIHKTPEWGLLTPDLREAVDVVSRVLPFRTNAYVLRELIDWSRVPDDPIFQIYFPQELMLDPADYRRIARLISAGSSDMEIEREAVQIRLRMNPQPDGQMTHNVPVLHGRRLKGLQHKYRETVLFFPGQSQTCHAYCTFCFRWAQFVEIDSMKFESHDTGDLVAYLRAHPEVTDVLFTGGDPMIMSASALARHLAPFMQPEFAHLQLRIGTKSVANWPHRYVTDADTDDVLRLFEQINARGPALALMAHYNHPRELATDLAAEAIRRLRSTGTQIRMQSPLLRRINDDPDTWARLWTAGTRLGCIPYYMFVERDTGPRSYFEVPLARAWEIFRDAYKQVSGLARTVRGPLMSALPGKVLIEGVADVDGEKAFVLGFTQARNPEWVRRPFFAKFDPHATWLDDLRPAFGRDEFFFAEEMSARERQTIRLNVL